MRLLLLILFISFTAIQAQSNKTNIRFAAKPEFNELVKAERLKSNDTETSQKAFQMEGPAWENELVGFRNYFDARNGIDIWGKRTPKLILDSVGMGKDYHTLDWWGMDILKVGNSLGAGAIALAIGDSIYRIGADCKGSYRLISEGATQSSFELKFENWKVQDRNYTITHIISISAGKRYYESLVKIDGGMGDEKIISGIVNLHSKELLINKSNESIYTATHDKQAYNGEFLGMAIMLSLKYYSDTLTAPKKSSSITDTYMIKMNPDENREVRFRFYSCWEIENSDFANKTKFLQFLDAEL